MKAFCAEKCLAGGNPCLWLNLVKRGKFKEAWLEIIKYNPLPAVIGRVCPHPCEDACKRVLLDESISINFLEGFLGELAIANNWRPPVFGKKFRKTPVVAIVGSGPAGLSCAYQLARRRYQVVLWEGLPVLGGMLRVGIPEFRLPRDILDKEIDNIIDLGVEIHKGVAVDQSFLNYLEHAYDAVFIAVGLQKNRKLNIPGEDGENENVMYGLDFLKRVNRIGNRIGKPIFLGEKVIVIGGGNTAVDVSRTAKRFGSWVSIFYRRSRLEMPALKAEVSHALAEGVKIEELALPVSISRKFIEFQRAKLGEPDETGRRKPLPIEGSNFKKEFDSLIIAAGEEKDSSLSFASGSKKIFVVEDAGTVAEAIKIGREAAEKIVKTLELKARETKCVLSKDPDFYLNPRKRSVVVGEEVQRCLGCGFEVEGLAEVLIDKERCKGCKLCCDVCPYRVLEIGNQFNKQGYLPAISKNPLKCRGCSWCALICPDAAIEVRRC